MVYLANSINIILDTTPAASASININSSAVYTGSQIVTVTISTSDSTLTGYQMLIWGDVDNTYNAFIQSTQGASTWISYNTSQSVKLSSGDTLKTLNCIIRDDVWNQSSIVTDTITLDSSIPIVTISGVDVTKVSKISGRDTASFSFYSDSVFSQYKIKVVPSSSSLESAGVTILTVNGSINMSGTGSFPATTPVNCILKGSDLEFASVGDGNKVIKAFVQEESSSLWSI